MHAARACSAATGSIRHNQATFLYLERELMMLMAVKTWDTYTDPLACQPELCMVGAVNCKQAHSPSSEHRAGALEIHINLTNYLSIA